MNRTPSLSACGWPVAVMLEILLAKQMVLIVAEVHVQAFYSRICFLLKTVCEFGPLTWCENRLYDL